MSAPSDWDTLNTVHEDNQLQMVWQEETHGQSRELWQPGMLQNLLSAGSWLLLVPTAETSTELSLKHTQNLVSRAAHVPFYTDDNAAAPPPWSSIDWQALQLQDQVLTKTPKHRHVVFF